METHAELGTDASLKSARERFDAAVVRAISRHDERDVDGNPPECRGLSEALDVRFGRAGKKKAPEEPSEAAKAVRATWEQAIAEGLPEIAAAERCLEIARRFEKPLA
jgi:hypothetical protein